MTAESVNSESTSLTYAYPKSTPVFHHSQPRASLDASSGHLFQEVFHSVPPWLISASLHTILIVLLGILTWHPFGETSSTVALDAQIEEQAPVVTFASPQTSVEAIETETTSSAPTTFDDLPNPKLETLNTKLNDSFPRIYFANSLTKLPAKPSSRNGKSANGAASQSNGNGKGSSGNGEASFYGIKAKGQNFIYVLDNSGSMAGNRWLQARNEVIRSIDALKENQKFLVVLYNTHTQVMLNMRGKEIKCLHATEENKKNVVSWLYRQYPKMDTLPLKAIKIGIRMQADHIFLLSDGEFSAETLTFLRKSNFDRKKSQAARSRVNRSVVHTIAFKSYQGAAMLKQIARENSGSFKYVE